MPRDLTAYERAVLAHVVADPDAWWSWANEHHADPEGAIAEKITRWQSSYDAAKVVKGEAYQTRAQIEAEVVVAKQAEQGEP